MKYLGKYVFVPFISEDTNSPIGVFKIDLTERYFSTMADIVEPFGNDIEEGGQCQEQITDNQQNANVKRFYNKWNYKHLKAFSSFTVEKMSDLESNIDQLVEKNDAVVTTNDVSLSAEIDIWCKHFSDTANEFYGKILKALKDTNDLSAEQAIDNLFSKNIAGLAESLQEYNIVDDDYSAMVIRDKAEDDPLGIASFIEGFDESSKYHVEDYGFSDAELEGAFYDWLEDQIEFCEEKIELAK